MRQTVKLRKNVNARIMEEREKEYQRKLQEDENLRRSNAEQQSLAKSRAADEVRL